jgi:hypothetical protein
MLGSRLRFRTAARGARPGRNPIPGLKFGRTRPRRPAALKRDPHPLGFDLRLVGGYGLGADVLHEHANVRHGRRPCSQLLDGRFRAIELPIHVCRCPFTGPGRQASVIAQERQVVLDLSEGAARIGVGRGRTAAGGCLRKAWRRSTLAGDSPSAVQAAAIKPLPGARDAATKRNPARFS